MNVICCHPLTFHMINFCSETTKWNSSNLDMKQELNILYQVWVFSANRKCCHEFELVSCAQGVSLLWSCNVRIVYKQVENAKNAASRFYIEE